MLIGELSRRAGVSKRLLRYYERMELIHSERRANGGLWFTRCVGPTLLSVRGSPCKRLLGPPHGERYSAMMTGVRCALSDAQLTCECRICIAEMISAGRWPKVAPVRSRPLSGMFACVGDR
ncbi:MerR family DNA-binding transcriptional regulator [Streptomyces sp. RPA4-5]|nr:MerR family DNA-binding transcriptional regulator [Streptomyces sp. RPA4-5]